MNSGPGVLARLDEVAKGQWARIPTPLRVRIVPGVLLVGTGVVLALSAWLTPAAEGHATHLQLGLNPCTILTATGYPCPMCGATTTFALMAHGRPLAAFLNQPFASLLFAMTIATFGISGAEVLQPRRRWERLLAAAAPWEIPLVVAFLGLMTVSWVYKSALMA